MLIICKIGLDHLLWLVSRFVFMFAHQWRPQGQWGYLEILVQHEPEAREGIDFLGKLSYRVNLLGTTQD